MNIDKVHLLHCILSIFSVIWESIFYVRTLFLGLVELSYQKYEYQILKKI